MTNKHLLLLLTTTLIVFSACKKDSDIFIMDQAQATAQDTVWQNTLTTTMPAALLKNSLSLGSVSDTFQISDNTTTLKSLTGLDFTFPGMSCLDTYNNAITGDVELKTLLVKSKGDLIRMGTPTVSDDDQLLVSGGTFYTGLKKAGNKLHLNNGVNFNVRYYESTHYPNIQVFNADGAGPNRFGWIKNDDITNNNVLSNNDSLSITSNKLNWVNCGYYYDFTGIDKTSIVTDMPKNFTNTTTIVYLAFKNIRSVVELYGDANSYKFSSIDIPAGQDATLIVMSKQGTDYYFGTQDITTQAPAAVGKPQTISINPAKSSLENIKTYLSSL